MQVKQLHLIKLIKVTNSVAEIIKIMQFQMFPNLQDPLNISETSNITYLLSNHIHFSIIYNGSYYKINLRNKLWNCLRNL